VAFKTLGFVFSYSDQTIFKIRGIKNATDFAYENGSIKKNRSIRLPACIPKPAQTIFGSAEKRRQA
jgi:hypothetical protein